MRISEIKYVLLYFVLVISLLIPMVLSVADNYDVTLTLQNEPPTISPLHSLDSTLPYTNDTINCSSGTYYDFNDDVLNTQQWRWYNNSILIPAQTTQSLSLTISGLSKGSIIKCESRVNDGDDWSQWLNSSNAAIIQNSAPIISSPVISPDPINSSQTATCSWTYTDEDEDVQSSTNITWYVDDLVVETESYTGGVVTLSSSNYIKNQNVTCSILGYDGESNSSVWVNVSLIINNSEPTFTSTNFITHPSQKADTLTCSVVGRADEDGDIMTNYYQFKNSTGSILQDWSTDYDIDCEFITGCRKDQNITCFSKVGDGEENSSLKNATLGIINTPPISQTVYVYPFAPDPSRDIECRYTFYDIDDKDSENMSWYRWYLNDTLMHYTSKNISLAVLNETDIWKCEVTVNDYYINSSPVNSTGVAISGSVPSIITFGNNGTVNEGSHINFNWTWNDPQLPSGNYTHYICNTSNITTLGCADGQLCISNDNTSPSNCNFTPSSLYPNSNTAYLLIVDELNNISTIESQSWTFNHQPTITGSILLNVTSKTQTYNHYICNVTGKSDPDGDAMIYHYYFYDYLNNILQSDSGNLFDVNTGEGTHTNFVECRVRVTDGEMWSEYYNSTGHFRVYNLSYNSPITTGNTQTFYVYVNNTSTVNLVNMTVKDPYNIPYSFSLIRNISTNWWTHTFTPNEVGIWQISKIYTNQTNSEGYYFKGDGDTFTIQSAAADGATGGGGGGGSRTLDLEISNNLTGYCGDNICQQNSENPYNCWQDCKIDYDELFTCLWDNEVECNWSQTWFVTTLLVILFIIMLVSVYIYEVRGSRNKRR